MTPDEIADRIVRELWPGVWSLHYRTVIAAAIRAERERAEKAEAERETLRAMWIDSIDQRETWGIAAAEERIRAEAAEAERDEWRAVAEKDRGTLQPLLSKLAEVQAERDRLRDALRSIAANTCCDGCREAALVASAALRKTDTLPVGGTAPNTERT